MSRMPREVPGATMSADTPPKGRDGSPLFASFWLINVFGWFFVFAFGLITRLVYFRDLHVALMLTLTLDLCAFCLTIAAHLGLRHWVRTPTSVMRLVAMVLAVSLGGGLLLALVAHVVRPLLLNPEQYLYAITSPLVPGIYYFSIFLAWSLAYFWLTTDFEARAERLRRSEAQSAAARAELQQLRMQLDPHFLFNALNTVTAEIHERPDVALEMTRRIASYLRYCLDTHGRSVCWLADEIEAVKSYLRIQELRYDMRLTCVVDMDERAGTFPVPHLILQGLVENAVKHALRPPTDGVLKIQVSALRDGDRLDVVVTNPGRYAPAAGAGPGLGLANTRRRLELHFPVRHHLSVTQDGEVVAARLSVWGPICFA